MNIRVMSCWISVLWNLMIPPVSADAPGLLRSASELDYPPFALVRPDGSADGFSVDLLEASAGAVGLTVRFRVGPWHEIRQDLENGFLDVLPFVSYSAERDRVFDFSAPYMRLQGTIFVREDETGIRTEADLADREVLVMRGDNAHEYALENRLTDRLILTDTYEEALRMLASGHHDAVLMLHLVGIQLIRKLDIQNVVSVRSFAESDLRPVARPLSGYEQKFCFAVREGNRELLSLLNEGLAIVIADGTYNALYSRWFGPVLPKPRVNWFLTIRYMLYLLVPLLLLLSLAGLWLLKKEVARKTRDLRKETDIRQKAMKELERSNAELQQFAYVASHDLQEPLRASVGFLQLLQARYQDRLDEKGNHYIERAVNAGQRMQTLINDLLSLSRIHTRPLCLAETDLNGVVREIREALGPLLSEKQAELRCEVLPSVPADRSQMLRLFQNLVVNALKYNESREPVVEIGWRDEGACYRFDVRDNGIGIDPRFHDRIFMIFQRLHSRQEYSGTGIGLALCRKIVERHGGTIGVESGKGRGATFFFTLPKEGSEI